MNLQEKVYVCIYIIWIVPTALGLHGSELVCVFIHTMKLDSIGYTVYQYTSGWYQTNN